MVFAGGSQPIGMILLSQRATDMSDLASQTTLRPAPRSAFPWYLTSSSLWMAAMSLQGFLITWMLVGILRHPGRSSATAAC